MKLTKFCHSCILVETESRVGLFDPGSFAWESGLVDLDKIERIDRIIITHAHEDHCHISFMNELQERFPQAHIIANRQVQDKLTQAGIKLVMRDESQCTRAFIAPHEDLPFGETPENTGFNFLGALTHPGDSFRFEQSAPILALPYVAPWGSTTQALQLAKKLKPSVVLPVHDWHLSQEGRQWYYQLLASELEKSGIKLLPLHNGESVELNLA